MKMHAIHNPKVIKQKTSTNVMCFKYSEKKNRKPKGVAKYKILKHILYGATPNKHAATCRLSKKNAQRNNKNTKIKSHTILCTRTHGL